MPHTIVRAFGSHDAAASAVEALKTQGYPDGIRVLDPSPTLDAATVTAAGVPAGHAETYAERARHGDTLVVIQPPFGTAGKVTEILHGFHPTAVDVPELPPAETTRPRDEAAPLSSWLGWRVLLSDPTPLSTWLGWRVLKPEPEQSKTLDKIRAQSDDPAPLSRKAGWRVLLDDATPLSNRLGWKTLGGGGPTPLSDRLGWRVLDGRAAPLSEKLGWRLLSSDPTPLSTWLGWKTLIDNPTPLSTWLGWPVLKKK